MSKCQTCEHFTYRAGISIGLQKATGVTGPTRPTCYCGFSGINWERYSAEIRKPRGIKCEYAAKKFTCNDCGQTKSTTGALIISSASGTMVCKKCMERKREEG